MFVCNVAMEPGETDRYRAEVIAMVAKSLIVYRRLQADSTALALLFALLFINIPEHTSKPLALLTTNLAYGVNVDMTAMIPGTPYTVRTASGGDFFDLAVQLGINALRITDMQWETTGEEYSRSIWHHVFDEARESHVHVILQLTRGMEHVAIQQAHTLLHDYGLAHATALWLIDLHNEPDVSDPARIAELQEEAAYVHQIAPAVPITIGGWKTEVPGQPGKFDWQDPADIPKFINLVDVVCPHLYQFEQGSHLGFTPGQWTKRYLDAVRQETQHKPILLEEFGAANGLAPTAERTTMGSPEWQARVYRGVLQEVAAERDQEVIGAVAWIIAPRPAWPDPYVLDGDMTGWAFVLNNGQNPLPAAKEFSAAEQATPQGTVPSGSAAQTDKTSRSIQPFRKRWSRSVPMSWWSR